MNPTSLKDLQRTLANNILDNARGRPTNGTVAGDLQLRLPPGIDAEERLAIYRDGYPSRILGALEETFPAIANILGDGSFANFTRRYIANQNLASYNLNNTGEQLPDYCHADSLTQDLAFLPDLARLEWAVRQAFHSHERKPISQATFSAWDMDDWERALITFQPSLDVVASAWPIHTLWCSRDRERCEIDIDLNNKPQTVLIFRKGYDVECKLISPLQARFLTHLRNGETLGRTAAMIEEQSDSARDTTQAFSQWMRDGLIVAVHLDEQPSDT